MSGVPIKRDLNTQWLARRSGADAHEDVIDLARRVIPDRMANYPWNLWAERVLSACLQRSWQSGDVEQSLTDTAALLEELCSASLSTKEPLFEGIAPRELRDVCEWARLRLSNWMAGGGLPLGSSRGTVQ